MTRSELRSCVNIIISDDKMKADLLINPKAETGSITRDIVDDILREKGIVQGIDNDKINKILADSDYGVSATIAKGVMPIEGKNGHYDFCFDTSNNVKKPKLMPDGSVDYYNLSVFQCVKEGERIAIYTPKIEGQDGVSIVGKLINAARVKDMPPLRGKGFSISEDGCTYYATVDGKPEFLLGSLNVQKICVINSDVDLSIGNVDFNGDVEIAGNVKAGFTVSARGNIVINGFVEAAQIKAGKSIQVKSGIMGNNKAYLEAGEDIVATFIENAKVVAGRDIKADSMVNCDAKAKCGILLEGKSGKIIGGKLVANKVIKAKIVGSTAGVKTELSVGSDAHIINEYMSLKNDLSQAEYELSKIEKAIELLEMKKIDNTSLKLQLVRTKVDKSAYIFKYREICANIATNIALGQEAKVIVDSELYSGVLITINTKTILINELCHGLAFKLKDEKLVSIKI